MEEDDYYINNILETMQKIASGDLMAKADLNSDNENFKSIAIGLNMLSEELYDRSQIQIKNEEELKNKIKELNLINEFMVNRELKMVELKKKIEELERKN